MPEAVSKKKTAGTTAMYYLLHRTMAGKQGCNKSFSDHKKSIYHGYGRACKFFATRDT
jgi:hypothetical protein